MAIQRLFVRKRDAFANEAAQVLATLQQELHVPATAVQIYERYDVENLSEEALQKAKHLIFSEPPVDLVAETLDIPTNGFVFAIVQNNVSLCSLLQQGILFVVHAFSS